MERNFIERGDGVQPGDDGDVRGVREAMGG